MRIGELSRRTGVHERSLRYYEQQGLLWPEREPSGYRRYREADVDTVERIRLLLDAGLGTRIIAEVLPCVRVRAGNLVPVCDEVIDDLEGHRDRLTRLIEQLTASRDLLDAALATAGLELTAAPGPPPAANLRAF